jgi:8-oxo-dGTP diphosphatase
MNEKVVAYITLGERLLILSHPEHPEAGIQVPSGTVEEGGPPRDAVLREAQEETGLVGLEIRSYLGSRDYDMSCFGALGVQKWHFYHLEFRGESPERWRHCELRPSDGSPGPIEFELSWVSFPDGVPDLAGLYDDFLSQIEISV